MNPLPTRRWSSRNTEVKFDATPEFSSTDDANITDR